MRYARPGCYFLRAIAKDRPYSLGGESDGQSLLCVWLDTHERAWIPFSWLD
jgi:hypothetical protein